MLTPSAPGSAHAALDDWLDHPFEPAAPVEPLLGRLTAAGLDTVGVEALLRSGRAVYPPLPCRPGETSPRLPLTCDHIDHAAGFLVYVPSTYDPTIAWPLVVIGHGGSSARDLDFGGRAARGAMTPDWCDAAERFGLLLLAPLSDRGWGAIGNSIMFSAISRMTRSCHVNPDRIYLTGHSMGGHLTWRSALNFGDRWGAVSPMSGGYDFVGDRGIENLTNVPGYATWGRREPFGIAEANRINRNWMRAHGLPWVHEECDGGHEIFAECVPRVAEFFLAHPRDLYRREVHALGGGSLAFATADAHPDWGRAHTWNPARPILANSFHWLRLDPLPPETPREAALQDVTALLGADNTIAITCVNARRLRLGLHPRMVDFARPVRVIVNGQEVLHQPVTPDLATMLRWVREFDDRGRAFHAALDVAIPKGFRGGAPPA